jgi:asparagine synthase (glutamine-hydrolysing)
MCGICGIANYRGYPSKTTIRQMCDSMVHRGPDGEGIYVAPSVGIGMRRLAVIDLQTGQQPITNETGTVRVVFNGEIYNYRELREQLEVKGHGFHTASDTEIIPHLYEEYGLEFPARLNGMFAIALWDCDLERLVLIRDRTGIKPLLYSVKNGVLYFGSEIKCILAVNGSDRKLDVLGLDQLLTFEYTASPRTLFSDVSKLPPGSILVWHQGRIEVRSFWDLSLSQQDPGWEEEEWADRLRYTMDNAVRRQMVSDVPLGSFLSGGVDSSIIVSAMSRASSQPIKTFSIGFANESYNELLFAREVAARYRTDHHETMLEPQYLSMVEEVISHMDQPIGDFSVFPTLLISKVARKKVTVVLSGDGGDELFAGYDTYGADRWAQNSLDLLPSRIRRSLWFLSKALPLSEAKKGLPNKLRRFFDGGCYPKTWQHMRWMTFLSPQQREELFLPDVHAAICGQHEGIIETYLDNGGQDRLQRQLYCDTRFYLSENILPKVDLMSMATSLEARVPYLDNEVLDLILRMPSSLKCKNGIRKYILKKAYAPYLPPSVLSREKQGFSIPLKTWLNNEWNGLMSESLSHSELEDCRLFNTRTVERWMGEHETGKENHSHILWALMVFQLWRKKFLHPASAPMEALVSKS